MDPHGSWLRSGSSAADGADFQPAVVCARRTSPRGAERISQLLGGNHSFGWPVPEPCHCRIGHCGEVGHFPTYQKNKCPFLLRPLAFGVSFTLVPDGTHALAVQAVSSLRQCLLDNFVKT